LNDSYVVATTTIWSGASYVYSKDAVKILTPPPPKEGGEAAEPDGTGNAAAGKDGKDGSRKDAN
jgi:hypothetical protein